MIEKSYTLFGLGFVEMILLPQLGCLRGVFLANHLASTNNLTRTTKRQNTYKCKLMQNKKGGPLINSNMLKKTILRERT